MSIFTLFVESKGKTIVYKGKELEISEHIYFNGKPMRLKFRFIRTDSTYKQGVCFEVPGIFEIDGVKYPNRIVCWEDLVTKEVEMLITPKKLNDFLVVVNVWDDGSGIMKDCFNYACMNIKIDGNKRKYICNDGVPDDDIDDLEFEIEILEV